MRIFARWTRRWLNAPVFALTAQTCVTRVSVFWRVSPPSTAKSVLCAQRYARPVLPSVRNTITTSTAVSAPSRAGGVPRSVDRWPLNVGVLRVSDMARADLPQLRPGTVPRDMIVRDGNAELAGAPAVGRLSSVLHALTS